MIVYHLRTLTPLALTLTLACQDSTADSSENKNLKAVIDPDATRVETQIVTRQNTTLKIQLPGEIEGYRDAKVASAQGGLVEAVRVQEGDRVEGRHRGGGVRPARSRRGERRGGRAGVLGPRKPRR